MLLTYLPSCSPENIPHLSQQQSAGGNGNGHGHSHGEQRNSISGAPGVPTLHPTTSNTAGLAGSPSKEPSILQRGMSVDEQEEPVVEGTAATSTEAK